LQLTKPVTGSVFGDVQDTMPAPPPVPAPVVGLPAVVCPPLPLPPWLVDPPTSSSGCALVLPPHASETKPKDTNSETRKLAARFMPTSQQALCQLRLSNTPYLKHKFGGSLAQLGTTARPRGQHPSVPEA
jgi:hypothetical protein